MWGDQSSGVCVRFRVLGLGFRVLCGFGVVGFQTFGSDCQHAGRFAQKASTPNSPAAAGISF